MSLLLYVLRTAVEREEKKALTAAGINVTDRIFTAEEVSIGVNKSQSTVLSLLPSVCQQIGHRSEKVSAGHNRGRCETYQLSLRQYVCVCVCVQYLLKYNDVKTKRGVDLAEHLLAYYQAQDTYFKDNIQILNALRQWESRFQGQIAEVLQALR